MLKNSFLTLKFELEAKAHLGGTGPGQLAWCAGSWALCCARRARPAELFVNKYLGKIPWNLFWIALLMIQFVYYLPYRKTVLTFDLSTFITIDFLQRWLYLLTFSGVDFWQIVQHGPRAEIYITLGIRGNDLLDQIDRWTGLQRKLFETTTTKTSA